jgi:hypothetical protein
MLLFLATVIEQLDVALEHIVKRDVHNARFGFMLTDNAIELVLHQIAKDKAAELKNFSFLGKDYPHEAALQKALKRSFEDKIKFAKLEATLSDEVAQTVRIMHWFRNEVYHVGLQHESILPDLSVFYFATVCDFVSAYEPHGLGWGSNQKMPERARKYFQGSDFFPAGMADFGEGCRALAKANAHDPGRTVAALADHMDEVVENQDICLGIVADGAYKGQQRTRDQAIVETQAWQLAFTDEGKAFGTWELTAFACLAIGRSNLQRTPTIDTPSVPAAFL